MARSYTFFGGTQKGPTLREQNPNLSIEEEFSGVDYGIQVADYVVFPKMEDLLREVIPFVQYRKRGSKETVRMSFRLETSTRTYEDDPLYVIDGFMSRNTAFFISLKPENVISIKIINNPNKLAQFGRLGANGIIFVETKKREYSSSVLKANTFPVVGLSRPANYNMVSYSNANSNYRVPDMRSTLYWNPSLETDKTGRAEVNFFASDDIGPVRILVQGLTKDGRPFMAEQEIRVSFSPQPK